MIAPQLVVVVLALMLVLVFVGHRIWGKNFGWRQAAYMFLALVFAYLALGFYVLVVVGIH
jgi:hypothetical protein